MPWEYPVGLMMHWRKGGHGGVWYARFRSLVHQHAAREDKAGTFARRLEREGESLWMFLDVQGVEATNNIDLCRYFCCYDASLNSISPS